jgi:predicted 2-oxoglutarate/Fe(II)-dependent dioxygenase YbiX
MIKFYSNKTFSIEECKEISKLNLGFKSLDATSLNIAVPSRRLSKYGEVSDVSLLQKLLLPKISNFGISRIENSHPMFIQYEEGHYFKPHTDSSYRTGDEERVYTGIIQLSDSQEYEGGNLIVDNTTANRDLGTLTIFQSRLIHELTIVTKGVRNILVFMVPRKDLSLQVNTLI